MRPGSGVVDGGIAICSSGSSSFEANSGLKLPRGSELSGATAGELVRWGSAIAWLVASLIYLKGPPYQLSLKMTSRLNILAALAKSFSAYQRVLAPDALDLRDATA